MKFITLIIGLLVVAGCSKSKSEAERLKDSVVGSYEMGRVGLGTIKQDFLENGTVVDPLDDGKNTYNWKLVGREVHCGSENIFVYKIDPNGDLTAIAEIRDGKRWPIRTDTPIIFKRIK